MSIECPQTGRIFFYHRSNLVRYGTKLRCGNAWYIAPDQIVNWWKDLERLEVVK